MSELPGIILVLICLLAGIGGVVWVLILSGGWLNRMPNHLRGHFASAFTWTGITLCQTISLLKHSDPFNVIGHAAVLVAGWVMVPSWAQFVERRKGNSIRQDHRGLAYRLFVQTLWGPVLLGVCLATTCDIGGRQFDKALARRDLPTALLLQRYGMGDTSEGKYSYELGQAVENGDMTGGSDYLAVGVDESKGYGGSEPLIGVSIRQKNACMTRLLLKYKSLLELEPYGDQPLHLAVKSGDVRQAQILLEYGFNRKAYNSGGKTAFQLAKEQNDVSMVEALLTVQPQVRPMP